MSGITGVAGPSIGGGPGSTGIVGGGVVVIEAGVVVGGGLIVIEAGVVVGGALVPACGTRTGLDVPVAGGLEIAGTPVLPPTAAWPAIASGPAPAAPAPAPARETLLEVDGFPGAASLDGLHAAVAATNPATKARFRTTFIDRSSG
jgi:hypothetical protein